MSSFTIRTAQPEDEAAVTALLQASYPVLMAPDYEPQTLEPALNLMCRANPDLLKSGTYYLATDPAGEVIGCGGWSRARPGVGETENAIAHIRHFATHPDHIRKGVGAAILSKCIETARKNGIERLECYSSRSAVAFYKSQGFRVFENIDVEFTPDIHFPSAHMVCAL